MVKISPQDNHTIILKEILRERKTIRRFWDLNPHPSDSRLLAGHSSLQGLTLGYWSLCPYWQPVLWAPATLAVAYDPLQLAFDLSSGLVCTLVCSLIYDDSRIVFINDWRRGGENSYCKSKLCCISLKPRWELNSWDEPYTSRFNMVSRDSSHVSKATDWA